MLLNFPHMGQTFYAYDCVSKLADRVLLMLWVIRQLILQARLPPAQGNRLAAMRAWGYSAQNLQCLHDPSKALDTTHSLVIIDQHLLLHRWRIIQLSSMANASPGMNFRIERCELALDLPITPNQVSD